MGDCQVENLIICNCPHPIAMKTNQRENWRQMVKSWYMVFFQVNKYNETISHHHLKLDQVHLACRTQLLLPGLVAVVHHVHVHHVTWECHI